MHNISSALVRGLSGFQVKGSQCSVYRCEHGQEEVCQKGADPSVPGMAGAGIARDRKPERHRDEAEEILYTIALVKKVQ